MTLIFLIAAALFAAELLWFRSGVARATAIERRARSSEPSVSIIVAARNEEERIAECLASLARVDYPASLLEIVVIDDRSTDRTGAIVDEFASRHGSVRKVVSGPASGTLHGKANALYHGVNASRGEILLFTDADCRVQPSWVRETVSAFDERTGVVGGFTLLDANNQFEGMQRLDWILLFGVASAAAGWCIPLTAIGNNIAVRRAAYDQCGGYGAIPFSVTEDYALVQAILRKTPYTLRFPMSAGAVVQSGPCRTFRQLFRQKQRWVVGGLDMVLPGMLIMSVGWVYRAALLASIPFVDAGILLATAAVVACLEALFLLRPLREFGASGSLRYFAAFQLYYLPYVLLSPIVALLSRNVVWKERTLTKEGS